MFNLFGKSKQEKKKKLQEIQNLKQQNKDLYKKALDILKCPNLRHE